MNIEPPTETTAALGAAKPPPVTLLIVDDDDEIRESIRLVFADAADTGSIPYTVLEDSNGDEALTILRESVTPLVVLLDERMPGRSGEDLLREMLGDRRLRRRHAVILMSAVPHLSRRLRLQRLLQALSIELLPKPFMLEDLEQAVDRARQRLESRRPAFSLSLSRRRRP